MIFFWFLYYLSLAGVCLFFIQIIKNKFLRFFITPIIFGFFGSIWFINPGSQNMAPIISILFLESSIIDSNGYSRLIRPLISFIFLLEVISFFYYLYRKNKLSN